MPTTGEAKAVEDAVSDPNAAGDSGGDAAPKSSDASSDEPSEAPSDDAPAPPAPEGGSGDPKADLDTALKDLDAAWNDAEKARAEGDWAKYGEAQERLKNAIERADAANAQLAGGGN